MSLRKITSLFAASAALAIAAPAHAEWAEAKSKHFTVYGDMKAADLKDRTVKLEMFDAVLRGIFNVKTDDHATIYYVASVGEIEKLAGRRGVGGFYRATAQDSTGFIPEKMPNMPNFVAGSMSPERIMYHEYTHHMLLSNIGKSFPAWATEGLAELFMTAKFDEKGNVIIGAPNPSRTFAIASMSRWSVKQLIENGTYAPQGEERIELYSRGWALCHYLLVSGKRQGQFFKFIDGINSGLEPLKAGEAAFGNLDKLDQEVERYIRQAQFPSSLFTADKVKAPTEVTIRQFNEGEAAIFPHRMVSANGVSEKTAGPLAERARPVGARFPADAFVQRTMAEIEYDAKNYDAADAAADRALAADPNNIMATVYKGRVAAQRAIKSKDLNQWKEARRWFLKANSLNPDYALPFQLYYDSYVAAGVIPPAGAVTGINRAVYLVPTDYSLRLRAAIASLRAGDIKTARFTLAPFAFNPHGAGADSPVAKLVKEIDKGSDKDTIMKKLTELKLDKVNEFTDPETDEDGKDDAKKDDKAKS